MKKIGKYKEALGLLELNIGGVKETLSPEMGDNEKLANIITAYQEHKKQSRLLKEMCIFVYDLIVRENGGLTDEDKKELSLAIELNQLDIMQDVMVAFKWTTKEDLGKAKSQTGDLIKNLTRAND